MPRKQAKTPSDRKQISIRLTPEYCRKLRELEAHYDSRSQTDFILTMIDEMYSLAGFDGDGRTTMRNLSRFLRLAANRLT